MTENRGVVFLGPNKVEVQSGVTSIKGIYDSSGSCSRNLRPLQLIARCACFAQRAKMLSALSDYSSKGSVRTLELVEKY
jgi:hypothetical protein